MTANLHRQKQSPDHRIELKLREAGQWFSTMAPSPFNKENMDREGGETSAK